MLLWCWLSSELQVTEYDRLHRYSIHPNCARWWWWKACSHWDEWCLQGEHMTGYLWNDSGLKLSHMTVAALEDLGYEVDCATAENFNDFDTNYIKCLCKHGRCCTVEIIQLEAQNHHTLQDDKAKQEAIHYGRWYFDIQENRYFQNGSSERHHVQCRPGHFHHLPWRWQRHSQHHGWEWLKLIHAQHEHEL